MYVNLGQRGGSVGRGGVRRTGLWIIAAAMAGLLGVAGCSSGSSPAPTGGNPGAQDNKVQQQAAPAVVKPAAAVRLQPAAGAQDVSPSGPITVAVADGTIETVTLTNPDGKQVAGTLSTDKMSWTASEALGFNKTYTWNGTATGSDGKTAPISGNFTTVKPKRLVRGSLNVADGQTYGVAMPIAINFDAPVSDKAAAQKALSVKTSVPTDGAWAWLNDRTVHWRPKTYWAPGTEVTVTAKLYGIKYSDGSYGKDDVSSSFKIGRAVVVKANTETHRWVVYRNGEQVADYPASYGLDSDPGRVTESGTHVVMSKHDTYFMSNPKYDYENVETHWAVRISSNGVFSHSAPWSVGQQGKRNVSHGCANLSPANAKAYYDIAMVGDPVEVVGSSQHLSAKDGDYYDWALSWDQWLAKSAG
jgi:lipoprotein-anchoring transpeptidase ErfK/SrfK